MQHNWKVLVVSDETENRDALVQILDRYLIRVFSCSTAKRAHDILGQEDVNLIFCDARLPDGSYLDLVPDSARGGQTGPRLVVSLGPDGWKDYVDAMHHGAFNVVQHPVDPEEVEMILVNALTEQLSAVWY